MDINLSSKNLDKELDKLANFYGSGAGYGDPDAEKEHQRKFELLMHRQNLRISSFNRWLTFFNVILTLANVSILVYQNFFKV